MFKDYAIANYRLDSVVSFSSTLLQTLSIPAALLLFKPLSARPPDSSDVQSIFMVAVREERGRSADGSDNTAGVGKMIREREITLNTALVSVRDIAANDFVIQPERYVESLEAQRLRRLEAS